MPERGKVSQTFVLKVGVWVSMQSGNGSAEGAGRAIWGRSIRGRAWCMGQALRKGSGPD